MIELSCLHGSERYAACFDEVVARAVRVSQPAVLSALLVIQLFGIVIPPPYFLLRAPKGALRPFLGRSAPSLRFRVRFGIFCWLKVSSQQLFSFHAHIEKLILP